MELALLPFVLGINVILWTLIGGLRFVSERLPPARLPPAQPPGRRALARAASAQGTSAHEISASGASPPGSRTLSSSAPPAGELTPADVAVLIPAHNEEPVIAAAIASAMRLVPVSNIHVVADGCSDATAEIARAAGAQVLELQPARGKAGGIETALEHFDIPSRFAVLLIVDADTELDENYLNRGLPVLERHGAVALAGYAKAGWRPQELSLTGRFLVAYRSRLYTVMQWIKYGQTWRWTNVTPIVPGFASMYRTSALTQMELNPAGLVIEDFNMTFEIHRRRLGKIAFRPDVHATTQDPDNLADYVSQVKRWNLGFWQTMRRHGLWFSGFCLALVLFVTEVLVASIAFVVMAGTALYVAAVAAVVHTGLPMTWLVEVLAFVGTYISLASVILFVAVPDYILTCLTAIALRRPSLLLYGAGFLVLRFVDAAIALFTLPQAWLVRSDGSWTSPTRRPVGPSHHSPAIPPPSNDDGTEDQPGGGETR